MKKVSSLIVALLFLLLLVLPLGCIEEQVQQEQPGSDAAEAQEVSEAPAVADDVSPETVSRSGAADRLPGSLKWGSVKIHSAGEDFLKDHPDGLSAVSDYSFEVTVSGSSQTTGSQTESASSEPTASSGEGSQPSGGSGGGTTVVVESGGSGVQHSGTVTGGSVNIESSTSGSGSSGSGSSGNWWELD